MDRDTAQNNRILFLKIKISFLMFLVGILAVTVPTNSKTHLLEDIEDKKDAKSERIWPGGVTHGSACSFTGVYMPFQQANGKVRNINGWESGSCSRHGSR